MNYIDLEILTLAAKAGKIPVDAVDNNFFYTSIPGSSEMLKWNSLTDDGDCFRLAVALKIQFGYDENLKVAFAWAVATEANANVDISDIDNDVCACVRRAVSRVAAELGKALL